MPTPTSLPSSFTAGVTPDDLIREAQAWAAAQNNANV